MLKIGLISVGGIVVLLIVISVLLGSIIKAAIDNPNSINHRYLEWMKIELAKESVDLFIEKQILDFLEGHMTQTEADKLQEATVQLINLS